MDQRQLNHKEKKKRNDKVPLRLHLQIELYHVVLRISCAAPFIHCIYTAYLNRLSFAKDKTVVAPPNE